MSAQPQSLVKEPQRIEFVIPVALDTDVVGTDPLNGLDAFTPRSPNVIKDIRYDVDPAATVVFSIQTRRVGDSRKTIGFGGDFNRNNVRPPSAIGEDGLAINDGQFQYIERQLAGVLVAQSYVVTYLQKLNI